MRTYDFISEFNYELPDKTLTITVKGKMYPGAPATQWQPEEGPEIYGYPTIIIMDENVQEVKYFKLPENIQETIWERIYEHHEAIDDEI